MNHLKQQAIKALVISGLALSAALAATSVHAAWFDPISGLYIGTVCQTPVGWQSVRAAPVGTTCFSPAFGMGVITN